MYDGFRVSCCIRTTTASSRCWHPGIVSQSEVGDDEKAASLGEHILVEILGRELGEQSREFGGRKLDLGGTGRTSGNGAALGERQ